MKKFVCMLLIVTAVLFTGCSCNTAPVLEFENKWGGGAVGYSETITYDVSYDDDFAYGDLDYVKSADANVINCNFVGEYVINYTVINVNNVSLPDAVKNSDVINGVPAIVNCTSRLTLSAEYTLNDITYSYDDYIENNSYFCTQDFSFAPVYSESEYDYSIVKLGSEPGIERAKGKNVITYSTTSYSVKKQYISAETEAVLDETNKSYDYDFKSLVDNSAFLLAVRNVSFVKSTPKTMPTVHASYGEAQNLKVTYFDDSVIKDLTVNYNGEDKVAAEMNVKAVKYLIDSTQKSGTAQLLFIQSGEAYGITDKAYVVKYAEPLADYASYRKLGSLIYQLKSVEVSASV